MSETEKSEFNMSEKSKKSRSKFAAILFGLIAALVIGFSGESTFVLRERTVKEPRTREVVDDCKVIKTFKLSLTPAFLEGQPISQEACQLVFFQLKNPENFIEATVRTESYEEQVAVTVRERDWGAEISSRGLRLLLLGIVVAGLVFVVANVRRGGRRLTFETFDFGFKRSLTPLIIRALYVLGTIAAALGVPVFWFSTVFEYPDESIWEKFTKAIWVTPLSLAGAALWLILIRVLLESVNIIFRIADDLRRSQDD